MSKGDSLFNDSRLNDSIRSLVAQVTLASEALEPAAGSGSIDAADLARDLRGRPLFFDRLVGSGIGKGALVECLDGGVRYDFITGIGVHFFGHSDPGVQEVAVKAALADTVQQGNLHLGAEYPQLLQVLLEHAPEPMKYGWLATSGADANENALKVCRAARAPAHRVLAFEDCFAGRTTTMAEITDNPAYRKGQVVHGDVAYVPFYDPTDSESIQRSVETLRKHLRRHPQQYACMIYELVQGEGGFRSAPPAFFSALMQECRDNNVLVWVDEIQTFGRTTEMYATHALGLDGMVDVITLGKMLQGAASLYTEELNPPGGLLSGTFVGTTVALATGRYMLERLVSGGFYGPEGRIAKIEEIALDTLSEMADGSCKGHIGSFGAIGSMIWLMPFDGSKEKVVAVVRAAFDTGVVVFFTGHGPYRIRMLLPAAVITDEELKDGLERLGQAIIAVAG